ncbi:MAG: hypothetical protein PHN31_00565 [Candidatus Gracilibacteria bacterium]|nr:hypothetical protein [Candidatus Gracilibacteria bacterium]
MGLENYDDDLDEQQKLFLSYYEEYLTTMKDLGLELSDNAKLTSINTFKNLIKATGSDFESQIQSKYKIEKELKDDYLIYLYIKNNKEDIKCGKLLIIPIFLENGYIIKVYFIKNKDTLGNCKQEIKKFVEQIFSGATVLGGV